MDNMGKGGLSGSHKVTSPLVRWFKDSYQAKLGIGIFIALVIASIVLSQAEEIPVYEALLISFMMLLGDNTNATTSLGKGAVIIIMTTSIIFFAMVVGEVSSYILEKIINRGKVKVLKNYSGQGHVVICGMTSKIEGILTELRSEDLINIYPVVIISPNAADITFNDDRLRRNTYAIIGDPLDLEVLDRANVEAARSILVLSTDETVKGHRIYRDAYVSLVYKAIYNHLCDEGVAQRIKTDINVVLEFLDEETNLLPCAMGDTNEPEVYTTLIPGTTNKLTVEPIYLENMPRYLFTQSIIQGEVNEITHDLLSTKEVDTCEFYYYQTTKDMLGKSFNSVEKVFLETGVTPVGVLRHMPAGNDGSVAGYEKADKVTLLLNPQNEIKFKAGDQLVLISYDEKDTLKACQILEKPLPEFKPKSMPNTKDDYEDELPFEKIVILNWNPYHVRDLISELAKICANVEKTKGSVKKLEIALLTRYEPSKLEPRLKKIIDKVTNMLGRPMEDFISLRVENIGEPVSLQKLKLAGVTREDADKTRVVIVSEMNEGEESDLRGLHQLQIIENRISENMFTAVELMESKNFQFFRNTKANVVVSIEAFAEQLMAQAILKPYVTLIFRNLLTFSENTNEFYIREVPASFIGKSIKEFQGALVGYPVIFIGHIRPLAKKGTGSLSGSSVITINPKIEGEYEDVAGAQRVLKTDKFKKGDKVVVITREPELVDRVMNLVR